MKNIFFLTLLFSSISFAQVRVAFFEMHDPTGARIELEPNGHFFHVALELDDGKWIHTHPYHGVQVISHLSEIGIPKSILSQMEWPGISHEQVILEIGKPFDFNYRWSDPDTSYCSKLVGNLLNVSPIPMKFEGSLWKNKDGYDSDSVGLSPDDLFHLLISKGFQISEETTCENLLITKILTDLLKSKPNAI